MGGEANLLTGLLQFLFGDPLVKALETCMNAALTGQAATLTFSEWNVAIAAVNRLGWIMGFVNLGVCMVGAVHAAAAARPAESVKSFALAFLAWPLTAACVSVTITVEGLVAMITQRMLAVGLNDPEAQGKWVTGLVSHVYKGISGVNLVIYVLVFILLTVGVLLMTCMMAARSLCLLLLAAVAPIPIMTSGWTATRPAFRKWVQAVVGTLLVQPLSALIVLVGGGLLQAQTAGTSESVWTSLTGVAAIWMACFSPKLVMPLVSYIGDNPGQGMQQAGADTAKGVIRQTVQVVASVASTALAGVAGPAGLAGRAAGAAGAAAAGRTGEAAGGLARVGMDAAGMLGGGKGKDDGSSGSGRGGNGDGTSPSPSSGSPQSSSSDTSRTSMPSSPMPSSGPSASGMPGMPGRAGRGGVGGQGGQGAGGTPGAPGSPGAPGVPGSPGVPGTSGAPGAPGASGSPGAPGSPGRGGRGGEGGQGGQGGQGSPGAPGPAGPSRGAGPSGPVLA